MDRLATRTAYCDYAATIATGFRNAHLITLTTLADSKLASDKGLFRKKISLLNNIVSCVIYKTAYRKYGIKLNGVAFIESHQLDAVYLDPVVFSFDYNRDLISNLHSHLVIDIPRDLSMNESSIVSLIKSKWRYLSGAFSDARKITEDENTGLVGSIRNVVGYCSKQARRIGWDSDDLLILGNYPNSNL